MSNPVHDREMHRRVVADCGALVDLLNELYPTTDIPKAAATHDELVAWAAERRLVARLNTLRRETPAGSLPTVLQGA